MRIIEAEDSDGRTHFEPPPLANKVKLKGETQCKPDLQEMHFTVVSHYAVVSHNLSFDPK